MAIPLILLNIVIYISALPQTEKLISLTSKLECKEQICHVKSINCCTIQYIHFCNEMLFNKETNLTQVLLEAQVIISVHDLHYFFFNLHFCNIKNTDIFKPIMNI